MDCAIKNRNWEIAEVLEIAGIRATVSTWEIPVHNFCLDVITEFPPQDAELQDKLEAYKLTKIMGRIKSARSAHH